jgi:hypothetical protein
MLWPEMKEAIMEHYGVAGGKEIRVVRQKGACEVEVLAENHASKVITCDLIISEGEEELIISDRLASKLGLVLIDAGEGVWCFRDKIGRKLRRSY